MFILDAEMWARGKSEKKKTLTCCLSHSLGEYMRSVLCYVCKQDGTWKPWLPLNGAPDQLVTEATGE